MNKILGAIAALLLATGVAFNAAAHTTIRSSNPASGSVLTQSPPVFEMTFAERVRLTSLILANSKGEKKLAFKPAASALKFSSAKPGLVLGRNEIRWTALSQDGHVIKGTIIIVMRAPRK
jgi:methionine-rich copper-binding protein CopC